jgi:hypothetical protein
MAIARQMKRRRLKDTKIENIKLLFISLQTIKIGVKSTQIKEIVAFE